MENERLNMTFEYERSTIRICPRAIELLKNPDHIQLRIHNDKLLVLVNPCRKEDYNAFRVPDTIDPKSGMRVYSAYFATLLWNAMKWDVEKTYIIYGLYNKKENVCVFDLKSFEQITERGLL